MVYIVKLDGKQPARLNADNAATTDYHIEFYRRVEEEAVLVGMFSLSELDYVFDPDALEYFGGEEVDAPSES